MSCTLPKRLRSQSLSQPIGASRQWAQSGALLGPVLSLLMLALVACSQEDSAPTAPEFAATTPDAVAATNGKPKFVAYASDVLTLSPMGSGTATAWCPDGRLATGGGFRIEEPLVLRGSQPARIEGGLPADGEPAVGWSVEAENPGGFGPLDIQAYVICTN